MKIINKKTILMLCIGMTALSSYGQSYSSAIGLLGGYTQGGVSGIINYNYFLDRDSFVQAGLFISDSKGDIKGIEVPYNEFTFNLAYVKKVALNQFEKLHLNIGAGVLGGYEAINKGNKTLPNGGVLDSNSKFIYGALATGELDIYLNNKLNLIVKYNQFYHHNSDLGKFTIFAGAGLRYYLF